LSQYRVRRNCKTFGPHSGPYISATQCPTIQPRPTQDWPNSKQAGFALDTIIDIALVAILAAICCASVALSLLQLPGTWAIMGVATLYAWYYDWSRIGTTSLLVMLGLTVVGEIVETMSGAVLAKRSGASNRAAWYGLAGGMIGAIFLSIPVPVFGTIIGAAVGCFAGALIAELQIGKRWDEGTKSGFYTAVGRTLGSMFKVMIAATIACIATAQAVRPFWT
jgi:hypothetical protein